MVLCIYCQVSSWASQLQLLAIFSVSLCIPSTVIPASQYTRRPGLLITDIKQNVLISSEIFLVLFLDNHLICKISKSYKVKFHEAWQYSRLHMWFKIRRFQKITPPENKLFWFSFFTVFLRVSRKYWLEFLRQTIMTSCTNIYIHIHIWFRSFVTMIQHCHGPIFFGHFPSTGHKIIWYSGDWAPTVFT
jgi:hypothetical protein